MKLHELDLSAPRITVQGGPLASGRFMADGFLFTQSIDDRDALYCIDLHDEFSATSFHYPRERRILAVVEPPLYSSDRGGYADLARLAEHYGTVWTFHPRMLAAIPHAKVVRIADKWVEPRGPDGKRFELTAVISGKRGQPNYDLRHEIAAATFNLPTRFYTGGTLTRKDVAFDAMFHLCIENTCYHGYVTEKLIDCFATYTVPLYLGDPDLSDEFDAGGVIYLDRDNWRDQINSLTPDDYTKRLPALINNYERSKPHWHFRTSLLTALRRDGKL